MIRFRRFWRTSIRPLPLQSAPNSGWISRSSSNTFSGCGTSSQGDLGQSIYGSHLSVSRIIIEAIPRTLSLASLAFIISFTLGLITGIVSAVKKYSLLDHVLTFSAFIGISMPDFWIGIVLIIIFASTLRWLPAIGYQPLSEGFWPWLSHLILPALAAGLPFSAALARITRSSMLEVLQKDYITVARSKG